MNKKEKYAEKLKDPRWLAKRQEILERDNYTCQRCGDTETPLHVHHRKYTGEPWQAPNSDLICYCSDCHFFLEKSVHIPWREDKCLKQKDIDGKVFYATFCGDHLALDTCHPNSEFWGDKMSHYSIHRDFWLKLAYYIIQQEPLIPRDND